MKYRETLYNHNIALSPAVLKIKDSKNGLNGHKSSENISNLSSDINDKYKNRMTNSVDTDQTTLEGLFTQDSPNI